MLITLQDVGRSRIPVTVGVCDGDYARLSTYVNEAQEILIKAAGETGFWGGWDKLVFNVLCSDPYITLPVEYARVVGMDICRTPVRIQNQWYETLEAGVGLQTPCNGRNGCGAIEAIDRGMVSTAYDLTPTHQLLRAYVTDSRDVGKRILFQGAKDQNGHGIYQQDVQYPVIGAYLVLDSPFATTDFVVTSFSAIQKDQTYGDVVLYEVHENTGDERFLARFGPQVMAPQYRRYYLNRLPRPQCCIAPNDTTTQVSCLAKLEYRPALNPTDRVIIGNLAALKKQCSAVRHGEMETDEGKRMAILEHAEAMRLLNQEISHYQGETQPAINVAPFGTARLESQRIGALM